MNTIIENICTSCNLSEEDAQIELDSAIRNLKELRDLGDLRETDFEDTCLGLGLDLDYIEYFIHQVAC